MLEVSHGWLMCSSECRSFEVAQNRRLADTTLPLASSDAHLV
jgi:hypothetical protein